jgi:hypothetical protein
MFMNRFKGMAAAAMSRSAYLPREQTDPDAPLDYAKVLKFFMNPDTTCIHTRQLALLKKICRNNYDGYKVTSLPYIAQLLDHAHERANENQVCMICILVVTSSTWQRNALHVHPRSIRPFSSHTSPP